MGCCWLIIHLCNDQCTVTSPLVFQTAEPVLEVLDEIGEVQARNPIISTLAEGQRRIDQDFREGVPVVDRIGAPFRAVQQGRNSIDIWNFGCKLGSSSASSSGTTSVLLKV